MKIEIVGIYPKVFNKKFLVASMHVFLIDDKIDLRGITIIRTETNWFFDLPYVNTFDQEEKKSVKFPAFQFLDREKNKDMLKTIIELGKKKVLADWDTYPICTSPKRERKFAPIHAKKKSAPAFVSLSEYNHKKNFR